MKKPDNQILRFLYSFSFISLIVIFLDFVLGSAFHYLYTKQKSGLLYTTTYAIDSTRADYVIFGSSRAKHHYDPNVFETSLNRTFYNCGRDGEGALYSCAIISALVSRYSPKGIIFDIRPNEFTESEEGCLSSLLPYFRNNAIKPYLKYNGNFEYIKLLSHIYPYNSLLTNLINGFSNKKSDDYNGYVKRDNLNMYPELKVYQEEKAIDNVKVEVFFNLIKQLSLKKIPTLLIISPFHYRYKKTITYNICLSASQKFNNVTFLDFVNDDKWQNNDLFSDDVHLNSKGASIFSQFLSQKIKSTRILDY